MMEDIAREGPLLQAWVYWMMALNTALMEDGFVLLLDDGVVLAEPIDVVFIAGAVPEVPAPLLEQLADDGRLVYVNSGADEVGRAMLVVREETTVSERDLFDATTPTLPGFVRKRGFVF